MTAAEAALREVVRQILTADEGRRLVRDLVRAELEAARAPAEFLSVQRAAEVADVAAGTIRRWIREGRIEGHRAGRVLRVKRADLEALLAAGGARRHELTPEELADRAFGGGLK